MITNPEQSIIDAKLGELIAKEEGYSPVDPSLEEQELYLNKYSLSALVFSTIYFWHMKDKAFFWLSILTAIFFFPLVFVYPAFARSRAWKQRKWHSFNHFALVQKKWDNAAIYYVVLTIILFSVITYFEVKLITGYLNSAGIENLNDAKQMQQELQSIM